MAKTQAKRTFNPLAQNSISGEEVPSLLDTSIKPGSRKNILLLKVPYCVHYESQIFQKAKNVKDIGKAGFVFSEDTKLEDEPDIERLIKDKIKKDEYSPVDDIKTKSTFKPIPSLAIATLSSFFEKYKT